MNEYTNQSWDDQRGDDGHGLRVLDNWFSSSMWKNICNHADNGDDDSLEVMEVISSLLCSMVFHLENNSSRTRVDYEIHQLKKYIARFQ